MRRIRELNERQDEKLSMKNIRNKNQALTREQPSYTTQTRLANRPKSQNQNGQEEKKISTIIWGKELESTEMT